ncbi:MAG: hypothetical protein ACLF0P_14585, partial [Thermoanaerobaculia bacterium]
MRRPAVTRARGPAASLALLVALIALVSTGSAQDAASPHPEDPEDPDAQARQVPAPTALDAEERARKLIEDPRAGSGPLEVGCQVLLEDPENPGETSVPFQITMTLHPEHPPVGPFRVTFVAATLEGDTASAQSTVELEELAETRAWVFR